MRKYAVCSNVTVHYFYIQGFTKQKFISYTFQHVSNEENQCWYAAFILCHFLGSVNAVLCFQSSLSDKFKRPFKKRHSSLPHAPSNRVNKYLAQAIDARSVDREKSTHVSLFTLCFRDREKERHVSYFSAFTKQILKGILRRNNILPWLISVVLLCFRDTEKKDM